ncbi:MAG: signal peptidase II [Ferrovibrio sp.]|nr:signal peptidase II [Ferrovibrio sp.]MBX3454620.1 signal peptidase II [Ferrovibrio sp.]
MEHKIGGLLALLVLAADQLTKDWLIGLLAANPGGIELTSFFNLVMVWNRGVSFGLFSSDDPGRRWILILVTAAIVLWLMIWLWRAEGRVLALALGGVIGGALGNIVDRIRLGAVADFFDFHVAGWHWPAFNFADGAIVAGVFLLLIDSFRSAPGQSTPGQSTPGQSAPGQSAPGKPNSGDSQPN